MGFPAGRARSGGHVSGSSGTFGGKPSGSVQLDPEKVLRFKLALQRTRAATYLLSAVILFGFWRLGVLPARPGPLFAIFGVSMSSIVLLMTLYRLERGRLGRLPDFLALLVDIGLVSWAVAATGGLTSPWYVWYLGIAGEGAFLLGATGVVTAAIGNTVGYLLTLVVLGHVGAVDVSLYLAAARMLILHGAAFFFLRGVVDLQEKKRTIQRLKQDESRKVEELTRLTETLDQKGRELADANLKISAADRMKSQFVANMSHELRTPLNSIIGFSDILLARLRGELAPKYVGFLENIHSSGEHLLHVINDILDLSKVESGRMDVRPEPLDVAHAVDGVVTVMKGMAARHEIAFDVDVPRDIPLLEADPVRFKQVLYNLLSNAVKFSPDRSTVRVAARLVAAAESPIGAEAIQIAVVDRGIGIDPKDHAAVFQPFFQADGTSTRKYEGTGLGLTLSKAFVELQGGTLVLESAAGKGSTFLVTLPRSSVQAPEAIAELPSAVAPDHHRILVIEDDPTAYDTIAASLTAASYIPLRARSGEEAIMLAHALHPSALTLDLVLPGLDGWEVLKSLKGDPETRGIPVIIVSMIDNRELGVALGADDYFIKPLDPTQLVTRLEELLPSAVGAPLLLVIDDDPAVHDLVDGLLQPLGYRLVHARSGAEGVSIARASAPSLVLLDLMMEGMDGFEVATRLQGDPSTAHLPILVLTARDLGASDRERLKGKITHLAVKGETSPSQLVTVIGELVRRHASEGARA